MGLFYQIAHAAAFAIALPYYALTRGGAAKYRGVLGPRFGLPPLNAPEGALWIQAVSVGEVGVARIFSDAMRAVKPDLPILVTTTTMTGQERARDTFVKESVGYFPFDFWWVVRSAVRTIKPSAFVMIETEIWPGMIEEISKTGVPVILVNARISDRSFPRYRAAGRLFRNTLARIDRALASSAEDGRRLELIGIPADRITVTGNLKFDRETETERVPWLEYRNRIFGERRILVAGSTIGGEESLVLEAFGLASKKGTRAVLVLAPRHPARFEEVAALLARSEYRWARRSSWGATGRVPQGMNQIDVLLLDTIGELSRAYEGAAAAFVGGSLVSSGTGHNPIEPSIHAVPVAVGPFTSNFRDVVEVFEREGALVTVSSGAQLGALWREWLDDPAEASRKGEAGSAVVGASRGAARRSAEIVAGMLRT